MTTDAMKTAEAEDDFIHWTEPAEAWEPVEYTTPNSNQTRGDMVIDFARTNMTFSRGHLQGQPLIFSAWQRWLIRSMFEETDAGLLRYRRHFTMIPRKNGKSLIGSAIVLASLVYSTPGDEIYSVAHDREQAKIVWNEVKDQVTRSPILSGLIEIRRDFLRNKATGVKYRALSSDANAAQGYAPSLVIADELHGWGPNGRELYSAMTEGSGDRIESIFIGISTAGASTESLLGELADYGTKTAKRQEAGDHYDKTFGFVYWGATEDEDPYDPETWKRANPNLAEGMMDLEEFRSAVAQSEATGIGQFLRLRLNMWVRIGGESFITARQYDRQVVHDTPLQLGARITVGFDGSVNDDNTGLVACDVETGVLYKLGLWKNEHNDPDWSVPRDEVIGRVEEILEMYDVARFYYDPYFFATDYMVLGDKHPGVFHTIPQTRARMAPLTAAFKVALTSGDIKTTADLELREHVLNAVLRPSGLVSKERQKSPKKIDLLICSILAVAGRVDVHDSDAWEADQVGSALFM